MKVNLLHEGTNGNEATYTIQATPVSKDGKEPAVQLPDDVARVQKELPRIIAMAKKQLGSMIISAQFTSPVIVLKANRRDSEEYVRFRGWLALFLDEPDSEEN